MIAASGTSAAVSTARTPASSSARLASTDTSLAWACRERRTTASSMPGTRTSATKRPAPEARRSPPRRGSADPIMASALVRAPRHILAGRPRPELRDVLVGLDGDVDLHVAQRRMLHLDDLRDVDVLHGVVVLVEAYGSARRRG